MQDPRNPSAGPAAVGGGVKARLALYQEQCRKKEVKKTHEELEVHKLNASLTDVSRFQSPTKSKFKPKVEVSPTKGKRPSALAVFQLELSPSAREEDDSNHNSAKNFTKSPATLHGSYRGRNNSFRTGDSGSTKPKGTATKPPVKPPLVQKSQQVKDEEEKAAKTELSKVLDTVEVSKARLDSTSEHKKDVAQPSFSSVRSRYLSAVQKLAPVDIKSKLSTVQDKQEYKEQRRVAIRAEQSKKTQYRNLKSAWDQYEVTAQDKSRDPDDEDEQEAREQLDKIEETIDKQWIGFVEDVVEVVQKHRDEGGHDDDGEEGDLLYWLKEGKSLKSESVARRKKKFEQRLAEEEQYWIEEAIKLRDQAKLKRSPDKGRNGSVHRDANVEMADQSVADLGLSKGSMNHYQSPRAGGTKDHYHSPKSLGSRVAEYTKAVSSSPSLRQAATAKEVEIRVEKYNNVRNRKFASDDDDEDDDDDLDFWIAEAKRLQGKPKGKFRNKLEEDQYWSAEARKLRDAVRSGKGPSPYGEVDDVEKAILEERIDRYNEIIKCRGHVEEDDEGDDDDLDFWIQEAQRLRGEPKTKFRSRKEEDEYWRQAAIEIRDSVRQGVGPNPYDFVHTVGGGRADDESDSVSAFNSSVRSLGSRVVAYTKATHRQSVTATSAKEIEEIKKRVQKYDEIKRRKYIPEEEDDDDDDLSFWISEAKRLQGTPKRVFRNKAEEDQYWLAEARKLRDAVRSGKGPSPYGDVDEAEKAVVEERVERYNEIMMSRKCELEDDDDEDEDLDFWVKEAKRLRGKPKKEFRSNADEEEYWRQEARAIRNSVRNGNVNPYDDIQTVQILIEADDDDNSDAGIPPNIIAERRATYNKPDNSSAPKIDPTVLEERVQKYREIKRRKYIPEEDDDDDDLEFWLSEAKRLRGDPKKTFKNQAEEDEYWRKEAIALRESIRNGTGPTPYDGMGDPAIVGISDSDSESDVETSTCKIRSSGGDEALISYDKAPDDNIASTASITSDSDSDSDDETPNCKIKSSCGNEAPISNDKASTNLTTLELRVEKYNEIKAKTRKYMEDEDDDDDDDLSFWISEAKRLKGDQKKAFKSKSEEEAYWRSEAIAVRESVRNGTGPSPYTEFVDQARGDSDDSSAGDMYGGSDSSSDSNGREAKKKKKAKKHKKSRKKARKDVDSDDSNSESESDSESEGDLKKKNKKSKKDGAPKTPKGKDPSPDNELVEQARGDPDDSSAEDNCSGSDPSSDSGREAKKKKKAKKHKKSRKKTRTAVDSDDNSSESDSDTESEGGRIKKNKKSKKSKKDGAPKTPKGKDHVAKTKTNGSSTLSPVKSTKSKTNADASAPYSSTVDARASSSSKLKSYLQDMSTAPKEAMTETELSVSQEPRNLDGSLWKNPLNRWTNRPTKKVHEVGTSISIKIATKTDCWRKTRHNFIMDNAPYNWHKVSGDFEVMVKVSGEFSTMYDKAGLMVRQDEENWILTGMEYFNDRLNHSTSITRDYTDWSLACLPATAEKGAWFRLRRMGNSIETSYSFDTESWVITRQGVFSDRLVLQVGLCGACPMGHRDLKVTFDGYRVKSI